MRTIKGLCLYFLIAFGFIWYNFILSLDYQWIALLVGLPIYMLTSHVCYLALKNTPNSPVMWKRDRKYIVFYTAQSRIEGSKARGMCLVTHKGKITSPNDLREIAAKLDIEDIESEDLTNHTITNYKLV